MRFSFKEKFAEFHTCGSRKLYTRLKEKTSNAEIPYFQCNPNEAFEFYGKENNSHHHLIGEPIR